MHCMYVRWWGIPHQLNIFNCYLYSPHKMQKNFRKLCTTQELFCKMKLISKVMSRAILLASFRVKYVILYVCTHIFGLDIYHTCLCKYASIVAHSVLNLFVMLYSRWHFLAVRDGHNSDVRVSHDRNVRVGHDSDVSQSWSKCESRLWFRCESRSWFKCESWSWFRCESVMIEMWE
jgi:hypothetical protein